MGARRSPQTRGWNVHDGPPLIRVVSGSWQLQRLNEESDTPPRAATHRCLFRDSLPDEERLYHRRGELGIINAQCQAIRSLE
jgi:hypothetical protein